MLAGATRQAPSPLPALAAAISPHLWELEPLLAPVSPVVTSLTQGSGQMPAAAVVQYRERAARPQCCTGGGK